MDIILRSLLFPPVYIALILTHSYHPYTFHAMAVVFSRPAHYSSLPEEIINNILAYLAHSSQYTDWLGLITSLQVSQQFYHIAIPLVYRAILCVSSPTMAKDITLFQFYQDFFAANPNIARWVQHLIYE